MCLVVTAVNGTSIDQGNFFFISLFLFILSLETLLYDKILNLNFVVSL